MPAFNFDDITIAPPFVMPKFRLEQLIYENSTYPTRFKIKAVSFLASLIYQLHVEDENLIDDENTPVALSSVPTFIENDFTIQDAAPAEHPWEKFGEIDLKNSFNTIKDPDFRETVRADVLHLIALCENLDDYAIYVTVKRQFKAYAKAHPDDYDPSELVFINNFDKNSSDLLN